METMKLVLLMKLFEAESIDQLKSRCPIDISSDEYNHMTDYEFIEMVKEADQYDDYMIEKTIKSFIEEDVEQYPVFNLEDIKNMINKLKKEDK